MKLLRLCFHERDLGLGMNHGLVMLVVLETLPEVGLDSACFVGLIRVVQGVRY